jgi:tetratricopeptide (TPR) repeat protein
MKGIRRKAFLARAVPWILILAAISCSPGGKDRNELNVNFHYQQGMDAYHREDYATYLHHFRKAVELSPTHPEMMFNLGRAYSLLGEKALAVKWLGRAVDRGLYLKPFPGDHLDFIRDSAGYKSLLVKAERRRIPVSSSQTAFVLAEDDFFPEGIAYDPVTEEFFIGSVAKRKIVFVDKAVRPGVFALEKQDGLGGVIGMKVDAKRRVLWVNSAIPDRLAGPGDLPGWSAVFKYDLTTGKLLKKYPSDPKTGPHLFNDLALNENGDVFITDSPQGAIYAIGTEKDELALWLKAVRMTFPNGIALSADGRFLYVSQGEGISVISTKTRSRSLLAVPDDMTLTGIDGLYFYENSLIAIQGDYSRGRVIRFFLNRMPPGGGRPGFPAWLRHVLFFLKAPRPGVSGYEILEAENPMFSNPTTGVLDQDTFYYIANTRMSVLMGAKDLPPAGAPGVVILKTRLR